MKTAKVTLMAMALVLACLSFATTARADGARSYISPSGSDNRPVHAISLAAPSTGVKADGGIIRVAYCSTTGNGTGWSISGGTIASMGNNMVVNNDIDIAGSVNLVTFVPR